MNNQQTESDNKVDSQEPFNQEWQDWMDSEECDKLVQAYAEIGLYTDNDDRVDLYECLEDNTYEIEEENITKENEEYNKLAINIDADATLIDTNQACIDYYNYKTGSSARIEDIQDFSLISVMPLWTKEQIDQMFCEEEFFKFIKPMKNSQEIVNRLIDDGHTVRIVTCHNPRGIIYKARLLNLLFPRIEEVVYITNINGVRMDKSAICGDILLDDNVDNLSSANVNFPICFSTYNYNKDYIGFRASDWEDFYRLVKLLCY